MNPMVKNDPKNILLLVGSILAVLLGLIAGGGTILLGVVGFFVGGSASGNPAWVLAGTFFGLSLLSLPAGWVALRAMRGESLPVSKPSRPFIYGSLILLAVVLAIGSLAFQGNVLTAVLGPPAHLLAALLPVMALVFVVLRGSPTISQRRGWGHFMAGLWLSPMSAMILEILAAIPLVLMIYFALNANLGDDLLLRFWEQPELFPAEDAQAMLIGVLSQPLYAGLILAYLGLLVPLIEELIKSIGLLPLIRRQISDAEGFLGGVLAGAGYGLFEALFLGQPGPGWALLMLARGGATMMHMLTAGLTGLGFARAKNNRSFAPLIGYYSLAVGLHALWNVAAVLMGIGVAREVLENANITPTSGAILAIGGSLVMLGLSAGAYIGLRRIPIKLGASEITDEPQISVDESGSG